MVDLLRRSGGNEDEQSEVADRLIVEFGSLSAILAGSEARLRRVGASRQAIDTFRWFRSTMLVSLRTAAFDPPLISTSSALRDYLHSEMSNDTRERFRTLYLNARNELLLDEDIAGTVDVAPFYPREIIGRAIEIGATSLIIVHNHPSGDPTPSTRDVAATVAFGNTCRGLGLTLLDHVIIARGGTVSLRAHGLLKP